MSTRRIKTVGFSVFDGTPRGLSPPRLLAAAALAALLLGASAPAQAEDASAAPEGEGRVLAGESHQQAPLLKWTRRGVAIAIPASVAARLEGVQSYPVDRDGNPLETGAAGDIQARLGLELDTLRTFLPLNFDIFGIRAPVGHDVIHWPQNSQLSGRLNAVPILVLNPLP